MVRIGLLVLTISLFGYVPCAGLADSLALGHVSHLAGEYVALPVEVEVSRDLAAANLRLRYPVDQLEPPYAVAGPLLSGVHGVSVSQPRVGEVNVVVDSSVLPAPMARRSGTLLSLIFRIRPELAVGTVIPVEFREVEGGSPGLVPSGLSAMDGTGIAHSRTDGSIRVQAPPSGGGPAWMLYE